MTFTLSTELAPRNNSFAFGHPVVLANFLKREGYFKRRFGRSGPIARPSKDRQKVFSKKVLVQTFQLHKSF